MYDRLIGSTPPRTDPLIDCHAANGRLQDTRAATALPAARRDEQVEYIGPRRARRSHQHQTQLVRTQLPPADRRQDRRFPERQRLAEIADVASEPIRWCA